MKRKILLSCCCFMATTGLFAQQGITAAGGESTGTGGSVSNSIGQMDYKDASGTNGNIIEGLQQPYEISVIIGIEEKTIELSSSVYPNPSSENLTLKIESDNFENFTYQVYDQTGKMLETKRIEGAETMIGISKYADAKYFIKVIQDNKELKTYKITKQ